MIRIYIPSDISHTVDRKQLFILTRPFYQEPSWGNDIALFKRWELDVNQYEYTATIENANVMLLPFSINDYFRWGYGNILERYQKQCEENSIYGYAVISGDWGRAYPEHKNLIYFRAGGFRSQLSSLNQGFPVSISDAYDRYYDKNQIDIREKQHLPIIGFCGQASFSAAKQFIERFKFAWENAKRFLNKPFRKDWEPMFASAYERALTLQKLASSTQVRSNFVSRDRYRAGAVTPETREKTNREYFENIRQSDYILCLRGGGNFSVRFYETLMMGRIPVFVNTDCLMPFEDIIPWRNHVVWIEWKDRNRIDSIISTYHQSLSADQFRNLQVQNRGLWLNMLSIKGMLKLLKLR